jgi:hypothetical protein
MPIAMNGGAALLPAEDTQKDLSFLCTAKVNLSGLCPPVSGDSQTEDGVLHQSYEYVATLRRTLKIAKEGDIDQIVHNTVPVLCPRCTDSGYQGARIESLRDVLDIITTDLEGGTHQNK